MIYIYDTYDTYIYDINDINDIYIYTYMIYRKSLVTETGLCWSQNNMALRNGACS